MDTGEGDTVSRAVDQSTVTIVANEEARGECSNFTAAFKSYKYRWVILGLFSLLNLSNALLFGTFAPISDIAQSYFHFGSEATAVNLLSSSFLILYPLGSMIGVIALQQYKLRYTMLLAAALTASGAIIRCIGVLLFSQLRLVGSDAAYGIILFGQCTAALAFPIIMNLPAAVAAIYFPVSERDMCTTVGSLFNPVGNAMGQLLPPLLVHGSRVDSSIQMLLLIEMGVGALALVLVFLFAKDEPPTAPSASTQLKQQQQFSTRGVEGNGALKDFAAAADGKTSDTRSLIKCSSDFFVLLRREVIHVCMQSAALLSSDRNYVLLCFAFALSFGLLNALTAIMNQLLLPYGYGNTISGLLAVVTISAGLAASVATGYLMKRTRAYRTLLKTGGLGLFATSLLFLLMLRPNNLFMLLVSGALVGVTALPLLPLMMETCAETTYPVPEELSTGLLHNVANIFGTVCIFLLQALLATPKLGPPPLLPSSLFILVTTGSCAGMLVAYNGQYKRVGIDCGAETAVANGETAVFTPLLDNGEASIAR